MEDSREPMASFGIVAIGRNEGERLRRCIDSVVGRCHWIVYVDSGSTDGSVGMAQERGVAIVELDMRIPFTAARARNEGFRRLRECAPDVLYVQFVDGDCEVVDRWLETAVAFLAANEDVAVVCGRRRERHPETSIYNMLCDIEWDTPIGETRACGGDAMFRADAFAEVGGYRSDLIAGEEPELCVRLRANGWKVWRLDAEMTLHDAAMTRFGQWWKRTMRGGFAFAEGAHLHGAPPEHHWVIETRRAWVWGLGIPISTLAMALTFGKAGLLLLLVYPIQIVRLGLRGSRTTRENWLSALFMTLGKFPEMLGQLKFVIRKVSSGRTALIEYKR